jgi:hypothetical protein
MWTEPVQGRKTLLGKHGEVVLFGNKTVAWFDVWSFEHFMSGMATVVTIEFLFRKFLPEIYDTKFISEKKRKGIMLIGYAVLVYLWETIEFYLEEGYTNIERVTYWFQGVEFWANRLITDPAITLSGAALGLSFKRISPVARVISLTWLMLHVFVFPDCMYLQNRYFGTLTFP